MIVIDLLPELPVSPYLVRRNEKKAQHPLREIEEAYRIFENKRDGVIKVAII